MVDNSVDLLTVIIRTASPERLHFLDEALFSVSTQTFENIEVLVMVQSPNRTFYDAINSTICNTFWPKGKYATAVPVEIPAGVDGRARLLNEGLTRSSGRYIAFLDDDDVVYQSGYEMLITELRQSDDAIAVGGCRIAYLDESDTDGRPGFFITRKERFDRHGKSRTKFDLFDGNFIPVHSYVLDRARIAEEDLRFNPTLKYLEDYEFLVRIAAKHTFNLTKLAHPMCEYRYHSSNSFHGREKTGEPALAVANEAIDALTESITFSISKRELKNLLQPHLPRFFWARAICRFDRWAARICTKEYARYKLRKWKARYRALRSP